MKLVIVSTFWNTENFVKSFIDSLKNQYFTNFVVYMVDDMSTDNSYEIAKNHIKNDERFILIKNKEKKWKTKNFIDVIKYNEKIEWDDVIIEIDGDDRLSDNFVLGLINKVYSDENVWICGSKWEDKKGNSMKYGKQDADNPRTNTWNFSHMRTYRAFLFRLIEDEHLKFEGEYFKAACDLAYGTPMLEMSGNEHYYFLDQVTYIYNWHDKQTYSENNSFGDKTLQSRSTGYIRNVLPRYEKLNVFSYDDTEMPEKLQPENRNVYIRKTINDLSTYIKPQKKQPTVEVKKFNIPRKDNFITKFRGFDI